MHDWRDGNLALHLAASAGRLDLVTFLVRRDHFGDDDHGRHDDDHDDHGGDDDGLATRPRRYLQQQNRWGCTPHDMAFVKDHREVARFLQTCCSEVCVCAGR